MSHTGCFDRHRWIQHIFGAACGRQHTLNQLHLDHYSLPTCYIHRLTHCCSASAPSSSVFPYTPFSVFAGVANMTEHRWNADTDLPKCLLSWRVQRYTENRNHVQHCKALWVQFITGCVKKYPKIVLLFLAFWRQWQLNLTQETGVCVLSDTKCHKSFTDPSRSCVCLSCFPKLKFRHKENNRMLFIQEPWNIIIFQPFTN